MKLGHLITNIILLAAVLCLFPGSGFLNAQSTDTGALEGTLFKKDKKTPLKNYRIVLTRIQNEDEEDEESFRSEPTDENGRFELTSIPPGIYKVGLVTNKGKKPSKTLTVVNLRAGESLERSFYYKPRKPILGFWNCAAAVVFAGLIFIL